MLTPTPTPPNFYCNSPPFLIKTKRRAENVIRGKILFVLLSFEGNGEDDTFRNFVPLLRGRENDKEFIGNPQTTQILLLIDVPVNMVVNVI